MELEILGNGEMVNICTEFQSLHQHHVNIPLVIMILFETVMWTRFNTTEIKNGYCQVFLHHLPNPKISMSNIDVMRRLYPRPKRSTSRFATPSLKAARICTPDSDGEDESFRQERLDLSRERLVVPRGCVRRRIRGICGNWRQSIVIQRK